MAAEGSSASMNIFLFTLIILLSVSFLCAVLIVAATIISSRAVKKLAQAHPTIYAEEALAQAHDVTNTQEKESALTSDSKPLMTP